MLGLVHRGHTGHIYLISRHGAIPAILPINGPIRSFKVLTEENLSGLMDKSDKSDIFNEVFHMFKEEIELAQGSKVKINIYYSKSVSDRDCRFKRTNCSIIMKILPRGLFLIFFYCH